MSYDIVIIGAGLSGLFLASKLERSRYNYLLIEARNRLGGRIQTVQDGKAVFDLGPTWFWAGQPRLKKFVKHFNIPTFEQYSKGLLVYEDEKGHINRTLSPSPMQDSYRLEGGMTSLITKLAKELPKDRLIIGTPVVEINRHKGIKLSSGKFINSRTIILSLPPRLAANLTFTPSLSNRTLKAMQEIPTWMGGQAKFLATYDKAFWREEGLSGDVMSRFGPLTEVHDASPDKGGPAALFGFVGIPPHNRKNQQDILKQQALHQLGRLFGKDALEPRKVYLQDWVEEDKTSTPLDLQAVYVHPHYEPFKDLNGIWKDHLHFCVSETASQSGGYLEGCLCAAEDIFTYLNRENIWQNKIQKTP